MINAYEPSSHIFKILVDSISTIGKKTHSKDHNVAHRVLSQVIVNKNTSDFHFLKPTSILVNLNDKTIHMYSIRREILETIQTDFWSFSGRLSHFDMKLIDAIKGLMHNFGMITPGLLQTKRMY